MYTTLLYIYFASNFKNRSDLSTKLGLSAAGSSMKLYGNAVFLRKKSLTGND